MNYFLRKKITEKDPLLKSVGYLCLPTYDKKGWMEMVKNINGRKRNVEQVCWEIPNVKQSYRQLKKYVGMKHLVFKFEIEKDIAEEYIGGKKFIARNSYQKKHKRIYPKLNETQKRAILALEEKLMLEGKRNTTIKSYKNNLRSLLTFYKNKKPSTISFDEINRFILVKK